LETNPDNSHGHRWAAILGHIQARRGPNGHKHQIIHMEKAKYHLLKAVELDPTDAVSAHMLGDWYFQVSEQNMLQRATARIYYTQPLPTAHVQDALKLFLRAEKISDKPWKRTLLQIGKCYERLGFEEKAIEYCNRVAHCCVDTLEDHHIKREAQTLIRDIEYRNYYSAPRRLFHWVLESPLAMITATLPELPVGYNVANWNFFSRRSDGHAQNQLVGRETGDLAGEL